MADENTSADTNMSSGVAESEPPSENDKVNPLLVDLACDYAKYVKVDVKAEKTALDEEVEDLLTRVDEFSSLVDMVRSDDALCLNNTLPEIYLKSLEMEKIYAKIEKLENVMNVIKQNVDEMEEKVSEAEYQLGSSSMKKLLSTLQKPLFSKKSSEVKKQPKYEPPEIFHAEDLFVKFKTLETASEKPAQAKPESSIDVPQTSS